MARHHEENERIKRAYVRYLSDAEGLDEKSIDKALASIRRFEDSTGGKSFKLFHRHQASDFKDKLATQRNQRTGKPLAAGTIDSTLRQVQAFFHWLAGRPGFKSVLTYEDARYFNNTMKARRIANTKRDIPFPTMAQCERAFKAMPEETEQDRRNKALFAFLLLTAARIGAVTSLKIKHVGLEAGQVFHDAREVQTKAAKTFRCQFFPVDPLYHDYFARYVDFLLSIKLFGPEDALFPKCKVSDVRGKGFTNEGLDRVSYANSGKLNAVIRSAFARVQLPEYTPHSFRKTLMKLGDEICTTAEELKAWSMNLGHENLATSINSYLPVSETRQLEIIEGMTKAK